MMEAANKARSDIEEEIIKNTNNSLVKRQSALTMLESIIKLQLYLDILLKQTEEVGGFGSYYPKKCIESLKTLKTILEMELKG